MDISIYAEEPITLSGLRVRIALTEDSLYYSAPNGTLWHNYTMRDMIPTADGTALTISQGETVELTELFSVPLPLDMAFCRLVVWVQADQSNYEVLQAARIGVDELVAAGYAYLPGDANMYSGAWPPAIIGSDVTYLINFFNGEPTNPSCQIDGFWASADANGDCLVIGSDVTKLVNYFRWAADIGYCLDYEPLWPTEDDLPDEAPEGWPNCDDSTLAPNSPIGILGR